MEKPIWKAPACRTGAPFSSASRTARSPARGVSRSAIASSTAAESRTERARTWSTDSPPPASAAAGPLLTRPRLGFSPNSPQQPAGMRIDPPPSLPWAMGTMPAATAAAEPPEDPPLERPVSHGLRVGPKASGSVVIDVPSSGAFVRPRTTKPARSNFSTR